MKKNRASVLLTSLLLSALMLTPDLGITAQAGGVGVASVIGDSDETEKGELEKAQESAQAISENAEKTGDGGTSYVAGYSSDLVMANVSKAMNVRDHLLLGVKHNEARVRRKPEYFIKTVVDAFWIRRTDGLKFNQVIW